ncbi:D-alanyl-D-alanine carboxypeptidase/D-alanyl-D-alanine-endopeptidase [Sodaliphilus sp.]|uniref:D-alanyl-D-alanine carboxypeptidase/D-alanyl-D-alanine endopeptidase n=1 Tax=Sodaliphilus sp. TaxID=2815818 RepID=UPI0038902AB6
MRRITITLSLIAIVLTAVAQSITPQQAVDRFVSDPSMKHASVGVMFMTIDSGKVIAAANPELSVVTASTMKTITSVAALEKLGGKHRFCTKVNAVGKIHGDTLTGNVVIVGSGDPTLGTGFIKGIPSMPNEIADGLKKLGIKVIEGKILTDMSLYPTPYHSDWWDVGDLAQDYGAGVFPINYRDNTIRFNFNIDAKGRIFGGHFVPDVPGLAYIDNTRPAARKSVWPTLEYGSNSLVLNGETASGKGKGRHSWIVANPRPDALLVMDIETALNTNGITVENKDNLRPDKWETTLIAEHFSPELTDIVTSLLDRSDNMFTHALLRAIAVRNNGDLDQSGVNEVKRIFKGMGIDTESLFMRDGSGLARVNRSSVHLFCDMLRTVADKRYNDKRLTDLMPRAKKRIGNILPSTPLADDLSLKSGSMSDVQCFVGYYPAENPTIVWAILAGNYTCSRATLKNNMDRMLIGALLGK